MCDGCVVDCDVLLVGGSSGGVVGVVDGVVSSCAHKKTCITNYI